jgi:cobalt-zinc-cadmium efflux system protein
LFEVGAELHERFGIDHATLQVETGASACPLASDRVV